MTYADLTHTEKQIADMIASGMTGRQIAAARNVGEGTIKAQVAVICRKLGINSRVRLAAMVAEQRRKA